MTNPNDDFQARVEDGVQRMKVWADQDQDFTVQFPAQALCAGCYLEGKTEQAKHVLLLVCPFPRAFLYTYTWNPELKRLEQRARYAIDNTAIQEMLENLVLYMFGKPTDDAVERLWTWVPDLLKAAEDFVAHFDTRDSVPSGNGFAAWVRGHTERLDTLRAAVKKIKGGET